MLPFLLTCLWIFSLLSAGHALLTKRDPRAAVGWIITCIALPGIGAIFYWLLGVNRIRTRARELQEQGHGMHWLHVDDPPNRCERSHFPRSDTSQALIRLSDAICRRHLASGNHVAILHNGEQAYPAMLDAIREAKETVFLSSYIFKPDRIGNQFAEALIAAAERGLDVRILLDAVGELYSFTRLRRCFQNTKVKIATFLPLTLTRSFYFNLRNHRKLLIVDNCVGFTGGMNICDKHYAASANPNRIIYLHFSFEGPISDQLRDAFMEDWHFATGEKRRNREWPIAPATGSACCRGISAGPNEEHEPLNWIFNGAVSCAHKNIRIMTPYFIPNRAQIAALNTAALRGVRVDILIPEKNNLPYVAWAANAHLFELLEHDTHIYYQPPPFVHSKLLLIDDEYALVGSANLDPRSLRLNFEFNVEIFDDATQEALVRHFDSCRDASREVTLEEMDSRPLPLRLRDSFCKLFSPYL
ncbi:MAG: cardiolipin synthase [Desulfuromonas sp.]|nr:MAG: cardiolipin synthase [Desulfuromonas sp.]